MVRELMARTGEWEKRCFDGVLDIARRIIVLWLLHCTSWPVDEMNS